MIALRLFSAADASRQIDVRMVGEREALTIGRDAAAGWALPDPDRALSRLHLTVAVRGGVTSVTDTSTNGVTLASRDQRLPRGEAVRVDPGERLELGPYVLLVERADHVTAPDTEAPRQAGSPFDSEDDLGASREPERRADPFASALPPDPLGLEPLLDPAANARPGVGLSDGDAWDHRDERRAGHWEGPSPARDPGMIIGSALAWREPPAAEQDERGFGFDTPFTRPIMSKAKVGTSDLAIPSDWDVPEAPASRPETKAAPMPEPVPLRTEAPRLELPEALNLEAPRFGEVAAAVPDVSRENVEAPARNETACKPEAAVERVPPPTPMPEPLPAKAPAASAPAPATAGASAPAGSIALFEAFCAGARLDPATFAMEDQAALMERLGTVYRHMVLGLSDVLGERTALKSEYRMVRTTISAEDNNPLKWAPPQKVAAELLRASNDGFLAGPAAVTESFQDIKKHLLCMLAGLRAALASTLDTLAPARIEEAIKDQSFVLKPRAAVAWGEYAKVYGQLRKDAEDNADSPVNREFRAAYEKQLAELDRMALR